MTALAHNVLVWAQQWLLPAAPRLAPYGMSRLVRDVLGVLGRVSLDGEGKGCHIVINEADRLAQWLLPAFRQLLTSHGVRVSLGRP